MPSVNISASGETEEDLTRAMNKAVEQCDLGWNRGQGNCKDGKATYSFTIEGYEKSPVITTTF